MLDLSHSLPIKDALHEWSKECGERVQMFYRIEGSKVFVYTTSPGHLIGAGGKRITKYQEIIKKAGAEEVSLVELKEARRPDYSSYTAEDWENL